MTEWDQMGIPVISTLHSTHIDLVNEGNYAYLTDATTVAVIQQTSCELAIFNDKMFPSVYGIGLQNNSAYTKPISKV